MFGFWVFGILLCIRCAVKTLFVAQHTLTRTHCVSGQRIFCYPNAYRVQKALVAARYVNVEIDLPKFDFANDRATPEFRALTPLGKVPVMDTPYGPVFESNAIARYSKSRVHWPFVHVTSLVTD